MKNKRHDIAPLVSREKFVSRSLISASFSLVESFASGIFFTAINLGRVGNLQCSEDFIKYAKGKESAALKDRIDRIVKFASQGNKDGQYDPFKSLLEEGKRFRDAIHHTTPFERKDGKRLESLYNINCEVAIFCSILALETVIQISSWIYNSDENGEIVDTSKNIKEEILTYSIEKGIANIIP